MFTRNSSVEPKTIEQRTTRANGSTAAERSITAPSSGEKSVIRNDLRIIGQGLKIISRGMLQVDGEIEGDVQAAEVVVGEKGKVTGMVAADKSSYVAWSLVASAGRTLPSKPHLKLRA